MSEGLNWPWVTPIRSDAEREALAQVAASDGHQVLAATHLVRREGGIIGYASLGAVPLLLTWVHSAKVRSRESLGLLNLAENLVAAAGARLVCTPCTQESPFRPYMEGLGYAYIGESGLFLKPLKG